MRIIKEGKYKPYIEECDVCGTQFEFELTCKEVTVFKDDEAMVCCPRCGLIISFKP